MLATFPSLRCSASTDTALCGSLSGCEMLNVSGGHCLVPYPSSVFEADDGSTATGKRIAFLRRGMPVNNMGVYIDPIIQQVWDRAEPNGWHHHTLSNPLPNTPVHKILVHMSFGDEQVANIGTEIMVRSMGLPQLAPAARSFFDIPDLAGPLDSAMVESPPPETNIPPTNYGAHGGMRLLNAIQAQIDQFLRTGGDVQNFCSGPCDPE